MGGYRKRRAKLKRHDRTEKFVKGGASQRRVRAHQGRTRQRKAA